MLDLTPFQKIFRQKANPQKAALSQRFFKTGKGEYGEGDAFLGITVPVIRSFVRQYAHVPEQEVVSLLQSPYHEERLFALLVLKEWYKKKVEKKYIHTLYISHTKYINNWDLVDLTADVLVGQYIIDAKIADRLAFLQPYIVSKNIWERRIAILATFQFLKIENRDTETYAVAELLLSDSEILIHKAVGWMLREAGKRVSMEKEAAFLKKHYSRMPRTMLRYAIERFPEAHRKNMLKGVFPE